MVSPPEIANSRVYRGGMLRRMLEFILTTAAGALLGGGTGLAIGELLDTGPGLAITFAVIGGLNGMYAGSRRVYAWRTPGGWLAFVLDSTWALIGAAQGLIVNTYNTLRPDTEFSEEYSIRRNRHVFGRGFALKRSFATTQGNVISNARLGREAPISQRDSLIENHEGLHVWQQRWFGPLFPMIYVVWGVVGFLVGVIFGVSSRERRRRGVKIGKLVETAAYYDNPFEVWAYRNDDRWDRCSAQPVLKWGSFRWEANDDR